MTTRVRWMSLGERGEPYPAKIRALESKSGVYLFRDRETHEVLYVGESHTGRLLGTLTRHLQDWDRSKRFWSGAGFASSANDPGVIYARDAVEVAVVVTAAAKAQDLETRLIRRHGPRDNVEKLADLLPDVPF